VSTIVAVLGVEADDFMNQEKINNVMARPLQHFAEH
jgi:hypothetical protein